ncbi:TRAP transporter small permease subunit [Ramlibacter sp. AW1]|uniref:TRAP transporter small permease protein n=1 Tax=Ramlibacter aurantiacus TaxID=2801330 RepID=A0A936ZTL5_9BURK|nr:TRAP transporter small permease subunit [Ramlibacter aurantiacus]MBL0423400.1 TRAP transporter small permease subunit [Ramlibacter aurantiacus]
MLKGLRALTMWFAVVGAAVALAVAVMVTWSVIGRAIWLEPVQGDVELTQLGIALSISLCIPWCQLKGANIIIDFFTQKMRTSAIRRLDGFGCLMMAATYALLGWRTSVGAIGVRESMEATMILDLPMWWAYAALAPGLALACLVALVQMVLHFTQSPLGPLEGANA